MLKWGHRGASHPTPEAVSSSALDRIGPRLVAAGAEFMAALGPPCDIGRLRSSFASITAIGAPPPDVAFLPVDANGVPAEWALAPDPDPDRRLLFVHGGQYLVGDIATYRSLAGHLAAATGMSVLSIDYRLGPEHGPTESAEDVDRAYQWLVDHAPAWQGPAEQVVVAGDSAGGALATNLAIRTRDRRGRAITGVVLMSPAVDPVGLRSILPDSEHDRFDYAFRLYAGPMPLDDPILSPIRADLAGLPPFHVQWSEAEPAAAGIATFCDSMSAAGGRVERATWPGMPHDWQLYAPALPEALDAIARIADFTQQLGA